MTTVTRRVLLYWLLLLLPTLVVGAGALWLVQREETRISEKQQSTDTARRSAMESRTRLIAENIETILSDVQAGLMATLNKAPLQNPASFLDEWQRANPLVRDTFQAASNALPFLGASTTPTQQFLATVPWRNTGSSTANDESLAPEKESSLKISNANDNVAYYNTARQDLQKISQVQNIAETKYVSSAQKSSIYSSASRASKQLEPAAEIADANHDSRQQTELAFKDKKSTPKASAAAAPNTGTSTTLTSPATPPENPDPTGWTTWLDSSGAHHLYGWRLCPDNTVLLVEMNIPELISRLRAVLPSDTAPGETFAITDTGASTTASPSALQFFSSSALSSLPGWQISGTLDLGSSSLNGSSTFHLLATLLVAFLLVAILSAGTLLLRQARLSAAESAQKTNFVSNVSHEFKTPLTTIRLYSELLEQNRIADPSKRAESLQTISRETQRLARLVNNVLDFSRLEQNRKKFNLSQHNLTAEIARIVENQSPRLAESGLQLNLILPDSPLLLTTDIDAIEQILLNLLDNACKYAASGREVTVTLSTTNNKGRAVSPKPPFEASPSSNSPEPHTHLDAPHPRASDVTQASKPAPSTHSSTNRRPPTPGAAAPSDYSLVTSRYSLLDGGSTAAFLSVSDRGPGIPRSHREKIFQKFHRVDDTLTSEKGGAGLGLSIARQLARALNGNLTYHPNPAGGSTFTLTLPTQN